MRTLQIIEDEVKSCIKCELHKTRTQTVFARGNPQAQIVIIGEGPGQEEDLSGLPFVGPSGKLLDAALTELTVNVQTDVYVCNIIKCRPPSNRKPSEDEVNHCIDYLEQQLQIVNPKVIIALGNTAVSGLLPIDGGITKIHGQFFKRGKAVWVMPIYHPSYVIRNGGQGSQMYQEFKKDLQLALDKVREEPHNVPRI